MIDFHTHLLPGIDDGSRSAAESIGMMEAEARQGVTEVVATPHFYADEKSVDRFLRDRQAALEKLQAEICRRYPAASESDRATAPEGLVLPGIHLAAEVYFFEGMSQADRLADLCLEGTKLLLLEMPFTQWSESVYREVRAIRRDRGLDVLLVHLERFLPLQKNKRVLEEVLELPLILQINAGSLQNWTSRRAAKKVLEYGHPVVLGSDCHSLHTRPVNIEEGCRILDSRIGKGTADKMMTIAQSLLSSRQDPE